MTAPERLPKPIGKSLGGDPDDAQVARMWAGIASRRRAAPRARRLAWASVAALGVAAALALAVLSRGETPGPLAMRDGSTPHAWSADASPRRVEMADASTITLAPHTRVEAVENGRDRFCVLLREGEARFSVTPGGPRRWIVEAGLATVEVVGTVFEVVRGDDGVRVRVQRGVVVVRGERVPNRVQRLEVGEELRIPAEVAVVSAPAAVSAPASASASAPAAASVPAPDSPDSLLDQADRARREGRSADAIALLGRVAASRDDRRAALAAFTRAKLELADPARTADAERDFERAIARGLPAPLDREAHARLADLRARAQ